MFFYVGVGVVLCCVVVVVVVAIRDQTRMASLFLL